MRCTLLYYFTLSNTIRFYSSGGECCHSMVNQICPCILLTFKWQCAVFIISLCLYKTPGDFTRQGENAATQSIAVNAISYTYSINFISIDTQPLAFSSVLFVYFIISTRLLVLEIFFIEFPFFAFYYTG